MKSNYQTNRSKSRGADKTPTTAKVSRKHDAGYI